ncbi:hypothetical protein JMUB6875_43160 [Nocardia sp. JMUB6875]
MRPRRLSGSAAAIVVAGLGIWTATALAEPGGPASAPAPQRPTTSAIKFKVPAPPHAPTPNGITGLQTNFVVPPEPTAKQGTVYIWPGLQPLSTGENYDRMGNGVLQPILAWTDGGGCSGKGPDGGSSNYHSWWIQGVYTNLEKDLDGNGRHCLTGEAMEVAENDSLHVDMILSGSTVWTTTVINRRSNRQVTFDMDLRGQQQNMAVFAIEPWGDPIFEQNVTFTDTTITYEKPEKDNVVLCTSMQSYGWTGVDDPNPKLGGVYDAETKSCFYDTFKVPAMTRG